MIRPHDYTDRGLFIERGVLYRPKVGAGDGVIEEVPLPRFDAFLVRWFPQAALRRARARAALQRLDQQRAAPPAGTVTVRRWDHERQCWDLPVPPPPASVLRDRHW
jgi:hypothetical protein